MSISKILFSFSGRIPRSTYWLAMLGIWGVFFALAFATGLMGGSGHRSSAPSAMIILFVPMYVCVIWCSLAVTIKRWHDRGKSGFWMFIYFVPFIGPLWHLLEVGLLEGTYGPNEFDDGVFARDVALDENDPLLSTPPIAGRQCACCQQQIVSFIGAELCPECKEPLHSSCSREHLTSVHREPARAPYSA